MSLKWVLTMISYKFSPTKQPDTNADKGNAMIPTECPALIGYWNPQYKDWCCENSMQIIISTDRA